MRKAAFFGNNLKDIERVYGLGRRQEIEKHFTLCGEIITEASIGEHAASLSDIEFIFSTWGMFAPSDEMLGRMPKLKAVLYAASSVKHFAEPFLRRGIQVISAASANAEFVADFAASQIQLAAKGFFHNVRVGSFRARDFRSDAGSPGIFEINVGLIGAGFVGRKVMARLAELPCVRLCAYDPYLSAENARALGVQKMPLDQLFATCQIVSNHAPDTPETKGMILYEHIAAMRPNGVLINTGRGATVDESGMIRALEARADLVAVLDVTWPEPPAEDSPLLHMPNVFYTTHIAGAHGYEVCHMADLCLEEALRIEKGQSPLNGVTLERLKTMA